MDLSVVVSIVAVMSFAGLGTVIRSALSKYIAIPYDDDLVLIPNLVGSFVLGMWKGFNIKHKYINAGIGTGLCGSITTFSSFIHETNTMVITNQSPNILLVLMLTATTFIGCPITFFLGEFIVKFTGLSKETEYYQNKSYTEELMRNKELNVNLSPIAMKETNKVLEMKNKSEPSDVKQTVSWKTLVKWLIIFVIMNGIVIPICFLINNKLWLAILFAPFGAAIRWYLGKLLNKNNLVSDFLNIPIGTLFANVFGCLLLALILSIGHAHEHRSIIAGALVTGFCGCLTTMSSFIGELFALKRETSKKMKETLQKNKLTLWNHLKATKWSMVYFLYTIILSQGLTGIVHGFFLWG